MPLKGRQKAPLQVIEVLPVSKILAALQERTLETNHLERCGPHISSSSLLGIVDEFSFERSCPIELESTALERLFLNSSAQRNPLDNAAVRFDSLPHVRQSNTTAVIFIRRTTL